VEAGLGERAPANEVGVTEREVRQVTRLALLPGQLDEAGIGVDSDGLETGRGEAEGEVAGTAGHVEDPDLTPVRPRSDGSFHEPQHLAVQLLVRPEARHDVV